MLVDSLACPAVSIRGQAFAPAIGPELVSDCDERALIGRMPQRQMIEATGSIPTIKVDRSAKWTLPLEEHAFPAATHIGIGRNARREASAPRIGQATADWQIAEHE